MKKLILGILFLSSILLGENNTTKDTIISEEQKNLIKKSIESLCEATRERIEQDTKQKQCEEYLKKADEILSKLEKNKDGFNDQIKAYSLYSSTLMKRYEICLLESKKNK